uniref:Uncharacterized protein n=1 Tax=Acrobeloides nanus TaxID=290746 RepID=A0A914DUC1_9BILA
MVKITNLFKHHKTSIASDKSPKGSHNNICHKCESSSAGGYYASLWLVNPQLSPPRNVSYWVRCRCHNL